MTGLGPKILLIQNWGRAMPKGWFVLRCNASTVRPLVKEWPALGVLVVVVVLACVAPRLGSPVLSVLVAGLTILAPYWLAHPRASYVRA